MERTRVVAAIIVDDLVAPTRVLGARRVRPERLAGRWEFPGGKVEPGESVLGALRRELHEELAVAVEIGTELAGPHADGWHVTERHTMRLWFATLASPEPVPLTEHDELRWLDAATLDDVPWLDGDVEIVDALRPILLR
ncbi:(deoxy)nucleoside triphosphate pyrophosphohydrolase [Sanguibacter sp. A247]|uniref:(deoxy)nucleoside triphosphate pyrophosphohydrolase n=1 Tax=unclassified Sanguibacter TaxID=2645534 RepID=UPI003FD85175